MRFINIGLNGARFRFVLSLVYKSLAVIEELLSIVDRVSRDGFPGTWKSSSRRW